MLLAGAPLAARQAQRNLARGCERRDSQLDGPNAPGWAAREERAATSVRRVDGEATLRALALTDSRALIVNRVPEVSLRRRRVLLVAARSSPCGAARGSVQVTDSGQLEPRILVAGHDHYTRRSTGALGGCAGLLSAML